MTGLDDYDQLGSVFTLILHNLKKFLCRPEKDAEKPSEEGQVPFGRQEQQPGKAFEKHTIVLIVRA